MLGDLTGRTLLVFPQADGGRVSRSCCCAGRAGSASDFTEMEQSAIKEAGNILSSAYMNALSDFMGMMLLPSPPSLAIDMSTAVLTTAYLQFGSDKDYVFCVESEFLMDERGRAAARLLPAAAGSGVASGHPEGRSRRLTVDAPVDVPSLTSERDREVLRSFARRIDPSDAGAHNNLGVLYYNKGLYEEAVAAFMQALELDPKMQVAQRNLEIAYFNTGYYDTRIPELRERLRARPDDREARWELGRTLALLGQTRRSGRTSSARCCSYHPTDVGALLQLALAEKQAATSSARRAASSARSRSIRTARCSTSTLGEVLYHRGLNEDALRALERAVELNPAESTTRCTSWASCSATWAGTRKRRRRRAARSSSIPTLSRAHANLAIDQRRERAERRGARVERATQMEVHAEGQLAHYNLGLAFRQQGLLRRGAARVREALERGEDARSRAAGDGRDAPARAPAEGSAGALRRSARSGSRQPEAVERARRRAAPGRPVRRRRGELPARAAARSRVRASRTTTSASRSIIAARPTRRSPRFARRSTAQPTFAKARLNLALLLSKAKALPARARRVSPRAASTSRNIRWRGTASGSCSPSCGSSRTRATRSRARSRRGPISRKRTTT